MSAGVAPTEDPFGGRAFISPAKVRILLTPSGPNVSPADFERWAAVVRSFESIRLADLASSSNSRPGPAAGSALHRFGEVHLSFVTSYDPSHSFLAPFALHRQVLGVLALGSLDDKHDYERAPAALRELHPNAIVHRAFLFDTKAGKPPKQQPSRQSTQSNGAKAGEEGEGSGSGEASFDSPSMSASSSIDSIAGFADTANTGLVVFPAVRRDGKDVRFYLRTLLRDFVGTLLDGLWDVVAALEGKLLETPRETLDGSLAAPASSSASTASTASSSSSSQSQVTSPSTTSSAASRASSFFSSFGSSSSSSSASSPVGGGTLPDALSPGSASGPAGSKTAVSQSSAARSSKGVKRSSSLVGAGPTGAGRYAKVRADYALLSGDLWGALGGYDTCMSWLGKERALAGGQDAVWYASALEGWAVARCLVFRMSGLEEKGPALSLPTGGAKEKDKTSKAASSSSADSPFSKLEWSDVAEAYSLAIDIYSKTLAPPRYLAEAARSVHSETPRDYTHPLIHASACIAYSRLLLAVWASGGWNAECFDQLIYGGVPPSLVEDARPGPAMYASLSKQSSVQRHDVAAPASLALSHSVAALKPPDQIAILCSLANVFGCVGFLRREAYLLRQLQAAVVSLLARTLLLHPRSPYTVSIALAQIAGSDHRALGTMVSQTLTSGLGEGADAVLILALQICETYGVNVDVEPLRNVPPNHILAKAATTGKTTARNEPLLRRSLRSSGIDLSSSDASSLSDDSPFGWTDLQVALLKDTICVAEMLQDHVGMAFFAAILLRDYHEVLSGDEQRSLMRGLARCVTTARWGDARDLEVLYWGPGEPLCSVESTPVDGERKTVQRPAKELADASGEKATASISVAGLNNPFFWNPTRTAAGAKDSLVLVQGEEVAFYVTLQNPFKTTLELTNVRLSTTGAPFEAHSVAQVLLPAQAYTTLRLTGVPTIQEDGAGAEGGERITVRGCYLTLSGCQEREFRVQVYDEATLRAKQAQEAAADDRRSRLKVSGLDARPAFVAQKRALEGTGGGGKGDRGGPTGKKGGHNLQTQPPTFLTCRIIPSQPLLQLDAPSSLVHGRISVLEGQTTIIGLRLTNPSSLPVDFVRLTLSDDATLSISSALREGDVLPEDAYHLESQLAHRPILSLPRDYRPRAVRIPPGRSVIIPLKLRGTLDCTNASVRVDYAHVDAHGRGGLVTEPTQDFWVRSSTLSFGVDVRPVVECCGSVGVKRMRKGEAERVVRAAAIVRREGAVNGHAVSGGHDDDDDQLVSLVSLDVRNVHHRDVEVALDVADDAATFPSTPAPNGDLTTPHGASNPPTTTTSITRHIPSNHTIPLYFILPQLPHSADDLMQKEVPSSSFSSSTAAKGEAARQFVLSRFKLDAAEAERARLRFWVGEEVRRRVRGVRWSEAGGSAMVASGASSATRQGDWHAALSEALQDLDEGACRRMLRREVEVRLDVVREDGEKDDVVAGETPIVEPETFHFLRLTCRNTTTNTTTSSNAQGRPLRLTYRLVPLPGSALSGRPPPPHNAPISTTPTSAQLPRGPEPLLAAGMHSADSVLGQVLITDGALSGALLGGGAGDEDEEGKAAEATSRWPALLPGKEASVSTGVLFLGEGLFRFVGCVEEMEDDEVGEEEEQGKVFAIAGKKTSGAEARRRTTTMRARGEVSIDVRVVRSHGQGGSALTAAGR